MKMVINTCYGGFGLSRIACKTLGITKREAREYESDYVKRTDEKLITLIEKYGSEVISGHCAELTIINIPDAATDWYMREYDGVEEVEYVLNGKIELV